MKKIVGLLCFLLIIFSCKERSKKDNKEKEFTISGEITGLPDNTRLYLYNLATEAVFDSTKVKNEKFNFKGSFSNPPEQIRLQGSFNEEAFYTNLLIGNEDIKIKGDREDFSDDLIITGSETQKEKKEFDEKLKDNWKERNALFALIMKALQEGNQKKVDSINKKITKIDRIIEEVTLNHINSNPDSYISMIELYFLREELSKNKLNNLYNKFPKTIKDSKYGKRLEIYLNEKILAVGDSSIDFKGLDQHNNKVKFSELRGSYTLIDFTSAYCVPCIEAIDELKQLKEKYADSLEIVSFSQDVNKETWKKSLERDKISWTSMWDGKGRHGKTSIQYGASGLPTFVVINSKGKIIEKWSGYGEGNLLKRFDKIIQ